MTAGLWRWLRGGLRLCAHPHTYRERRSAHGVTGVMHWVCGDCGAAWPVLERQPEEQAVALERGRIHQPRARAAQAPAAVVSIGRRGRVR